MTVARQEGSAAGHHRGAYRRWWTFAWLTVPTYVGRHRRPVVEVAPVPVRTHRPAAA